MQLGIKVNPPLPPVPSRFVLGVEAIFLRFIAFVCISVVLFLFATKKAIFGIA